MAFGLQTFNDFGDATFDSTQSIAHLSEFVITVGGYRTTSPLQTINRPPDLPANIKASDLFVGLDRYFEEHVNYPGGGRDTYGNLPISVHSVQDNTITIKHSFLPGWYSSYNGHKVQEQHIRIGWVLPL